MTLGQTPREAQRAEVATTAAIGRHAVVIGPPDGEGARALPQAPALAADAFLRDGAPDATALVALDPVPARLLAGVTRALAGRVDDGAAVVLAVGGGQEALVAPWLSEATVLRQLAVDAVWLGGAPPESVRVPLDDPAVSTVRVLFVAGGPEIEPSTRRTGTALVEHHQAALLREVDELRSANARLRAEHRPLESAAAGALVAREATVRLELDALQAEVKADAAAAALAYEAAVIEWARLERQLEREVGIGLRNDQLFQEARRIIEVREDEQRLDAVTYAAELVTREQEIAGLRATLARPRHRVAAGIVHRLERIPLLPRAMRWTGRRL